MIAAEYHDRKITARQAAERFAAEQWQEPRKVRTISVLPGDDPAMGRGCAFTLVGGSAWYIVEALPNYQGWCVYPQADQELYLQMTSTH